MDFKQAPQEKRSRLTAIGHLLSDNKWVAATDIGEVLAKQIGRASCRERV